MWRDVTVSHRRHGNDCPPEAQRDGGEVGLPAAVVVPLGVVDHGGEDEHADEEEYEEHEQLLEGRLERVHENLQGLAKGRGLKNKLELMKDMQHGKRRKHIAQINTYDVITCIMIHVLYIGIYPF